LKQQELWFKEECSKLLDQRKQAKLKWLQNACKTNGNNLSNVQRKTSKTFSNIKREHLKEIMCLKQTVGTEILEIYIEA
jgi:hypothetical protein